MPALLTTDMTNITEDVSALSLMANDASVSQRFSTLLQNRDVKGSLRTQKAIKNYSVKMKPGTYLLSTAYTPNRIMGILAGDAEQEGATS